MTEPEILNALLSESPERARAGFASLCASRPGLARLALERVSEQEAQSPQGDGALSFFLFCHLAGHLPELAGVSLLKARELCYDDEGNSVMETLIQVSGFASERGPLPGLLDTLRYNYHELAWDRLAELPFGAPLPIQRLTEALLLAPPGEPFDGVSIQEPEPWQWRLITELSPELRELARLSELLPEPAPLEEKALAPRL